MSDDHIIAQDIPFSAEKRQTLSALLGFMIPGDEALGMVSASDPDITMNVAKYLYPAQVESISSLLDSIDGISQTKFEQPFVETETEQQKESFDSCLNLHGDGIRRLGAALVQIYYRDDRVMTALGMEARAPFPTGYEVEQGDWSLLEPVRRKGRLWREVL